MGIRSRRSLALAVLAAAALAGCGATDDGSPPAGEERGSDLSPDATRDFIRPPDGMRGGRYR